MPVGEATLGRIMNVIGEPVDDCGPIPAKKKYSIHRAAPSFAEQSTEPGITQLMALVTGTFLRSNKYINFKKISILLSEMYTHSQTNLLT